MLVGEANPTVIPHRMSSRPPVSKQHWGQHKVMDDYLLYYLASRRGFLQLDVTCSGHDLAANRYKSEREHSNEQAECGTTTRTDAQLRTTSGDTCPLVVSLLRISPRALGKSPSL